MNTYTCMPIYGHCQTWSKNDHVVLYLQNNSQVEALIKISNMITTSNIEDFVHF
jgi:hypothetical protein